MIDIEKKLRESGLNQGQIEQIKAEVRYEFPNDDMMYELHLIRLVHSLTNGYCRLQDILTPEKESRTNQ